MIQIFFLILLLFQSITFPVFILTIVLFLFSDESGSINGTVPIPTNVDRTSKFC